MAAPSEIKVSIPRFSGLMQAGDGRNIDLQYAVEAINCDTSGGSLKPFRKGRLMSGVLPMTAGTIAPLYRRNYASPDKLVYVAAAGTKLYASTDEMATWTQIYSGITMDDMDYVAYETTVSGNTVDVLLLTNEQDGMFCVYGNDLHVSAVTTPYKFGVLTRHAERIWGSGITSKPDLLVYSKPYDPFNWAADVVNPSAGGGEISQPSWDGDLFTALKPYGDRIIAFKKNRVWTVIGTGPESYSVVEQFGGGAIEENTIAIQNEYAYVLSAQGIMRYNGSTVEMLASDVLKDVMRRIHYPYAFLAVGAIWKNKYFLAVPLKSENFDVPGTSHATPTKNTAVIVYDIERRAFGLIEGVNVKSFLSYDEKLFYTNANISGQVIEFGYGDSLPVKWTSGYLDFEWKNALKSGFSIYLTVEFDERYYPSGPTSFDMTFTVRTESKTKSKTFTVVPGENMIHLNISNRGRWVQFEITTSAAVYWEVLGGVQIKMEIDED